MVAFRVLSFLMGGHTALGRGRQTRPSPIIVRCEKTNTCEIEIDFLINMNKECSVL